MHRFIKFNLHTIIFIFLTLNNYVYSNSDQIELIDVKGTQRIDVETVISYSNVKQGDIYTEELGNQVLKQLFETNLFSNIEISFGENILTISVKENPTINLVKFIGNSKVKDEDLLIEISLK